MGKILDESGQPILDDQGQPIYDELGAPGEPPPPSVCAGVLQRYNGSQLTGFVGGRIVGGSVGWYV